MSAISDKYESGLQNLSIGGNQVNDFSLLSSLSEEASKRYDDALATGESSLSLFQDRTNELKTSIENDTPSITIQEFVRDATINGFLFDLTKLNSDKVIIDAFSPHQLSVRSGQMTYGEAITRSASGNGQYYSIYGNEIGATTKFLIGLGIAIEVAGSAVTISQSDTPLNEAGKQSWGLAGGLAGGAFGQAAATGFLVAGAAALGLTVAAPVLLGAAAIGGVIGFVAGEEYMEYAYDNLLPIVLDGIVDGVTTTAEISIMAFDVAETFVDDLWNSTGETAANFYDQLIDGTNSLYDDMEQLSDDYSWALDNPQAIINELPEWMADLSVSDIPGVDFSIGSLLSGFDPLTIDLDQDGLIELVSVANSNVAFDFWGDGYAEQTGWVASDDGLLVHDLDGDGDIENVEELFGSPLPLGYLTNVSLNALAEENGFARLALHDLVENGGNADGVIDAQDTVWAELQIWQDVNQDGQSQAGELLNLDAIGIASFDVSNYILDSFYGLASGGFGRRSEGHTITHSGFYTTTSGATFEAVDVWFDHDLSNTSYANDYSLDVRTLYLPTARGYGQIADLHIAMSNDNGVGGLLDKVSTFATSYTLTGLFSNSDAVRADVRDILMTWAGVDESAAPIYTEHGIFGELPEYLFLRKLLGTDSEYLGTWFDESDLLPLVADGVRAVYQSWEQALDAYTARFVFQGGGADLFESGVTYNVLTDAFEGTIRLSQTAIDALETAATGHTDIEGVWQSIALYIDQVMGLDQLNTTEITWLDSAVDTSSLSALSWIDIIDTLAVNTINGVDTVNGETLTGTIYDDVINSVGGEDTLIGGDGDDTLDAFIGYNNGVGTAVTLSGGAGNDLLYGGVGDNTYVYESGNDVIIEVGANFYGDTDIIQMGAGITVEDVSLHLARTDAEFTEHLFLTVEGRGTITIQNDGATWSPFGELVDEVHFEDGRVLIIDTMDLTIHGSEGVDYLAPGVFQSQTTYIYGHGGDDTFGSSPAGHDVVYDGGAGDDLIISGSGDDTFIMSTGTDTITETDGVDTIKLPAGYTYGDIQWNLVAADGDGTHGYDDIEIIVNGLGTILIKEAFETATTTKFVENLELDDGTIFNIENEIFTFQGTAGNDLFSDSGSWTSRDNIYLFGQGNDAIFDNTGGTDAILFGAGVTLSDLTITKISDTQAPTPMLINGQHLLIEDGLGNSLTVVKQFEYSNEALGETIHSIETLTFADGSTVNIADLILTTYGTDGSNNLRQYESTTYAFADEVIYGLGGNDTINGYDGNDTLYGGDGIDQINGWYGDDIIYGEDGVDNLYGDWGNDTLYGGLGDDSLDGGTGNDFLYGGDGNDTIIGQDGDDSIFGGAGDDNIQGKDGNNFIVGGAGNDNISAGSGAETFFFDDGFGDDLIASFTKGSDFIDLSHVTSVTSISDLSFAASGIWNNKIITVGTAGSIALFALGNTTFDASDFIFAQVGTSGNDGNLDGTAGWDGIHGLAGNDVLDGFAGNDKLWGDDGADFLRGHEGDDQLFGGNDSDKLWGYQDNDILHGDAGNDYLYGGTEDDILYGDDGVDTLRGQEGADTLYGGLGNDNLYGDDDAGASGYAGAGDDTLYGEDGNDKLVGGDGVDTLYGGNGLDSIYGNDGNDFLYGGVGYDFLYGGAGDDYIEGNDGEDTVFGGDGNDTILGGDFKDTLRGEGGNDIIYGGENAFRDTLVGGDGDDILYAGDGSDYLYGDNNQDTLYGEEGADFLYGGAGIDLLNGGDGDDKLLGGSEDDVLHGDNNTDRLFGEDGDDILYGDDGTDTLYGGYGTDTLIGGTGTDFLYGNQGADIFKLDLTSIDRLSDFNASEGDVIDIADLLIGYDSATDDINDFVTIVYRDTGRTDIRVNDDGVGTDLPYVGIVFSDLTGETVDTLVASGTLIVE